MNSFFGYSVVEKLKLTSFDDDQMTISEKSNNLRNVTNNKFQKKVNNIKNEKIRKSLLELTKVFKEK